VLNEKTVAVFSLNNAADTPARFKERYIKRNIALCCFALQAIARG
jgi:hypothetical protein